MTSDRAANRWWTLEVVSETTREQFKDGYGRGLNNGGMRSRLENGICRHQKHRPANFNRPRRFRNSPWHGPDNATRVRRERDSPQSIPTKTPPLCLHRKDQADQPRTPSNGYLNMRVELEHADRAKLAPQSRVGPNAMNSQQRHNGSPVTTPTSLRSVSSLHLPTHQVSGWGPSILSPTNARVASFEAINSPVEQHRIPSSGPALRKVRVSVDRPWTSAGSRRLLQLIAVLPPTQRNLGWKAEDTSKE